MNTFGFPHFFRLNKAALCAPVALVFISIGAQGARPVRFKCQQLLTSPASTPDKKIESILSDLNILIGELRVSGVQAAAFEDMELNKSYFDPLVKMVKIGLKDNDGLSRFDGPSFVHEYGHAIFNQHFQFHFKGDVITFSQLLAEVQREAERFKRYQNTQPYLSLKKEIDEIYLEAERVDRAGDWDGSMKLKSIGRKKMEALRDFSEPHYPSPRQSDLLELVKLAKPYNELFADLLAALYYQNGQVMADSLGFSSEPPFYSYTERDRRSTDAPVYRAQNVSGGRPRDFTSANKLINWRAESEGIRIYTLFDPTRSALWKLISNKFKNLSEEKILMAFLKAAQIHFDIRINRHETINREASADILNKEFINLLIQQFLKKEKMPESGSVQD